MINFLKSIVEDSIKAEIPKLISLSKDCNDATIVYIRLDNGSQVTHFTLQHESILKRVQDIIPAQSTLYTTYAMIVDGNTGKDLLIVPFCIGLVDSACFVNILYDKIWLNNVVRMIPEHQVQ